MVAADFVRTSRAAESPSASRVTGERPRARLRRESRRFSDACGQFCGDGRERRVPASEAAFEQTAPHLDRCQPLTEIVVEVLPEAAALLFCRGEEAAIDLLALGDVVHNAGQPLDQSGFIPDGGCRALQPANFATRTQDAKFNLNLSGAGPERSAAASSMGMSAGSTVSSHDAGRS